ncbi:MAG: (deoxy)nucleoside triphosphate pyrophosphohydrolase [Deltaproteobacteria bacterium]|nr:MAG: (deoxy)nucleoside triphosphate pyrophosphohydrolase [Deltaproteobacteria bacterium]
MDKRVVRVVVAVIERDGRYLIAQRSETAVLPLLWEFPGGRVEDGESDEDALRRELRERIGTDVRVVERIGEHVHEYDGYDVHLHMFACELAPGSEPAPRAVRDIRWVTSDELADYAFPPADQQTMDKLLGFSSRA